MTTSLRLVDFKNFADETLRVGPFTVIVGANASGKSNIRDAFRFLHGIGRDYTLAETVGGKYGAGGQDEWKSIRGAMNEIVRLGHTEFSLKVGIKRRFRIYPEMGSPAENSENDDHGKILDADYFIRISHDGTSGVLSVDNRHCPISCTPAARRLRAEFAFNQIPLSWGSIGSTECGSRCQPIPSEFHLPMDEPALSADGAWRIPEGLRTPRPHGRAPRAVRRASRRRRAAESPRARGAE